MKSKYNIQDWEKALAESGIAKRERTEKLFFANKALDNNVPVILDLDHLGALLGIKVGVLTNMIRKPISYYREFKIPKRSGGTRTIVAPHKSLLDVQRWIANNVLNSFEIHLAAFAYIKNKNVIQNASIHIGSNEMFKLDIKDFFPSIGIPRVRELFNRKGYSKEVSGYLSRLCCLNGTIPQGAAASPVISNVILYGLDKRLMNFSSNNGITYTRYADDLVFSGEEIPENFDEIVKLNIENEGFRVNETKTRFYESHHRKMVNGIIVNSDSIRLPKYKRRQIRQDVHRLIKYGILNQVKFYEDIFRVDRIIGRLGYWKQIEPNNKYVIDSINKIKRLYTETLQQISKD